jgi:hypothetical protein
VGFNLCMRKGHEQEGGCGMVCFWSCEEGKRWGGGREREGGRRTQNRTTKRPLWLFCCTFWPIETICFLLVFCIIRSIPWNLRPSKPYNSSVFYRMLQGENNDFPPKRGVRRKKRSLQHACEFWCAQLHARDLHEYGVFWRRIYACLALLDTHKGSPPSASLYLLLKASLRLCRQTQCWRTIAYYAYCPDSTPPTWTKTL